MNYEFPERDSSQEVCVVIEDMSGMLSEPIEVDLRSSGFTASGTNSMHAWWYILNGYLVGITTLYI